MDTLIRDWVGKTVTVTLRVGGIVAATKVEGSLLKVNDAGLVLEMPKGKTFVPTGALLHVSLLDSDG